MPNRFKRDLFRGSLDVMVLCVLTEGPQYGYAIQKKLKAAAGVGGNTLQAGTLYPLLHRMEDEGLIKATWERTTKRERKWYDLTALGKRRLRKEAADWQAYIARLQSLVLPAVRRVVLQD